MSDLHIDNQFGNRAVRASDLPPARSTEPLWFGFYAGKVVLLIGETGAGKSSLLYNLVVHACLNLILWGVGFSLGRPLRILYIDPENAGNFADGDGGLCRVKMDRIGQGYPVELVFHDGQGINLSNDKQFNELQEFILAERFDIVILDPIVNLFDTKNEDDNAEAAQQMKRLNALSRRTGACVVAVHHTGKSSNNDYGRGASARLGAADVGMVFRYKGSSGEEDDTYNGEMSQREDLCRLQIVKNRMHGRGSLYLKMAGQDRFELATFEDWQTASRAEAAEARATRATEEVFAFLGDGAFHYRAEIVEQMQAKSISAASTDNALKELLTQDKVVKERGEGRGGSFRYQRKNIGQMSLAA